MMNKKGFTLTEVLLAAMIVGIIGISLAALTRAALRESGAGQVRLMLRNQASLFLRQLRQDVRDSVSFQVENFGSKLTLFQNNTQKVGPEKRAINIVYNCSNSNASSVCTRQVTGESVETVLSYVHQWPSEPAFVIMTDSGSDAVGATLRIRLVVGMDTNPSVKEAIEETIMLPHGFAVTPIVTEE